MLGILLNDKERIELDYILRKELDEMIFDMKDERIEPSVRAVIELRYRVIFRIYARLASPKELSKYAVYQKNKYGKPKFT